MKLYNAAIAVILIILTSCHIGYSKKGNAVYYSYWNEGTGQHKDRIDADPGTFVVLKNERYAKDANTVFFDGNIVKGADAPSFESISDFYARDKIQGYYGKSPVRSSHGPTFRTIDKGYYSTDGEDVFFDTLPLHVCSVKDFKFVYPDEDGWGRWTTDGCYYYYMNFKVPSDDFHHVTVYKNSGGLAKDKRWVYFMDHKINFDVDGKQVIDTVDVATFVVTGFLECRDKVGCINPYHGREDCKTR